MLDPSEKSFAPDAQAPVPDVERERCDFIYRRALPGTGAALAFSLLLSAYLLRVRPAELVLLWLALAIGCAAYFAALALAYRRSRESAEPQLWIRRAAFAAAMLGASWGFAAAVFFPGAQDEQVLIAFVVALVTAGGLPLFSTVWWLYALYAAAVILPFNVVLFAHGSGTSSRASSRAPTACAAPTGGWPTTTPRCRPSSPSSSTACWKRTARCRHTAASSRSFPSARRSRCSRPMRAAPSSR